MYREQITEQKIDDTVHPELYFRLPFPSAGSSFDYDLLIYSQSK